MTTLDATTLDRIATQARELHVGRQLLTFIASVLYAVGWTAFKTLAVTLGTAAWGLSAVRIGWADARSTNHRRAET